MHVGVEAVSVEVGAAEVVSGADVGVEDGGTPAVTVTVADGFC